MKEAKLLLSVKEHEKLPSMMESNCAFLEIHSSDLLQNPVSIGTEHNPCGPYATVPVALSWHPVL